MLFLRLLLRNMQQKMISPRSKRNPRIDPTTIPAMAPPLRPRRSGLTVAGVVLSPVGDEPALLVVVVEKRLAIVEKTGRVTSWQRPVELEVTQQESVPFSVLERQKLHNPMRLSL